MDSTIAQQLKFDRGNLSFQQELRKRVDEYFSNNGISKNANTQMVTKTIFILVMLYGSYALMISNILPIWGLILAAASIGFFSALVGLNIGHDAVHGSYSSNPKTNKLLSSFFNLIGANDYMWSISHNMVHHTFTNIPEYDGDIDQPGVIRLNPKDDLKKFHKYQHFYIFFFYSLTSLLWVLVKDFSNFIKTDIGAYKKKGHPTVEWVKLIVFKLFYYTMFIAIPIAVMEVPAYVVILLFVFSHVVEGVTLAIIFQVGHLSEGVAFPEPSEEGNIENSWFEHQFYTTVNFANKSKLTNYLFGGLNFQIEHHIFPNICHVHYPKIAPIVKQTAEEFNVPYIDFKSIKDVLASHLKVLKMLGSEKNPKIAIAA